MSHLISDTSPLQNKPLINFQQRTFIKPNLKKLIKTKTQPAEIQPHQQIIDNFCSKLSYRQSIKLEKDNENLYINYKKKLKHKRNTSLIGAQVIEDIFTRDQERTEEQKLKRKNKSHINILKYLQHMPSKVNLHQKYNNKINQKINILQEMNEIEQKKQNYRNWYNENSNSPMKNPNFTKMTFLLQKISSENQLLSDLIENKINYGQKKSSTKKQTLKNSQNEYKSHRGTKSCVPNITLQPIGLNKYQAKQNSKWIQDSSQLQKQK